MEDTVPRIYSTGVPPIKKEQPKPKLKVSHETIDEQIQQFFKTKEITKVSKGHRAMPEYVWWNDAIPRNRRKR